VTKQELETEVERLTELLNEANSNAEELDGLHQDLLYDLERLVKQYQ
jgi:hypothetical protein